jgi:hypothetical protein
MRDMLRDVFRGIYKLEKSAVVANMKGRVLWLMVYG